jgi:prephenate dehydratase
MTGLPEKGSIYYLGPAGTHTHEAAWQFASRLFVDGQEPPTLVPETSIGKVIDFVSPDTGCSATGFACVPLENSIQGAVTMTWDRLFNILHASRGSGDLDKHISFANLLDWPGFGIRAVLTLPIAHHLLTVGPLRPQSVTHVYSHPQALAQCKAWLEANLPQAEQIAVASTAEAARLVQNSADTAKAAIGSARAGKEYGLHVSSSPIQDFDLNYTRFGLLANTPVSFPKARITHYVTSICLSGVQNQPGGLLKALAPFYQNGLNLTRIESRPVGHELGTYLFYLDVETGKSRVETEFMHAWGIVRDVLVGEGVDIVCLGSYPVLR